MNKPNVFNYKRYEELREAYKQLLEDNQRLMADNRRLRKELIEMEKGPTISYICDMRKCDFDCRDGGYACSKTLDINHAKNFIKVAANCYEEVGPNGR